MPNYDFLCTKCELEFEMVVRISERDNPQHCECGGVAVRTLRNAPQVRTPKTSASFLEGTRNDGLSEEIKAAQLEKESLNHKPGTSKHAELKAEAILRRKYISKTTDRPKNKIKISKEK